MPVGLRGRARVDYFSDITARQLYNNNLYQQTYSTRSIGGGISGAWSGLSVSGNYQRNESFYNTNDSFVSGQAPGLIASFTGRRIAQLPLYASANVDAGRVLYQQKNGLNVADFGLGKIDLLPSLRAPLSTLPFLSLNASIGYRVTYFSESLDPANNGRQIEEPVTRRYADMRAEFVGPVFTRVFTPNNGFADRLKHVVEPAFTLQRITSIDNLDQIPTTASYEYVVGGTTRMTYGLTNRLLVRRPTAKDAERAAGPTTAGAPREFLSVAVNQSYYTNEAASRYDNAYSYSAYFRPPSNFSHGGPVGPRDAGAGRGRGRAHGIRPDCGGTAAGGLGHQWRDSVADWSRPRLAGASRTTAAATWSRRTTTSSSPRRCACPATSLAARCSSTTTSPVRRSSTSATSPTTTRSAAGSPSNTRRSTTPGAWGSASPRTAASTLPSRSPASAASRTSSGRSAGKDTRITG